MSYTATFGYTHTLHSVVTVLCGYILTLQLQDILLKYIAQGRNSELSLTECITVTPIGFFIVNVSRPKPF